MVDGHIAQEIHSGLSWALLLGNSGETGPGKTINLPWVLRDGLEKTLNSLVEALGAPAAQVFAAWAAQEEINVH